jgi:hypothetical protein
LELWKFINEGSSDVVLDFNWQGYGYVMHSTLTERNDLE